ncbi:lytic transglycosylase domain-containing protein [Hydrogenophaga palleronii]|uniref:lytic transglycosylase domain-containing protein n=1 Tax=Hydrogenophaga palleronii TaxID=65655 RepID=UPI000A00BC3F|nr:lytic transglycosylase domain-containing protein [Hydrogenophaga palleronii]
MTENNSRPHQSTSGAVASLKAAVRDTYQGFFDITHNGLALLGTLLAVALITLSARADLRADAEGQLLGWLLQRQEAATADDVYAAEPTAIDRVTAAQPSNLPKQQANVTFWLSNKYRVAPEPLSVLVAEAFAVGERAKLDPTLILAVMAVESRFNPFAQSPVGAQGLMQVLTRVHTDKYNDFGGQLAAFDPVSNLRVGARVLQDAVKRAGSVEGGLRLYVGAVTSDGSWYINRVMAEHLRIQSVALGKPMQRYVPQPRATQVVAPADAAPAARPAAPTGHDAEAEAAAKQAGEPVTQS